MDTTNTTAIAAIAAALTPEQIVQAQQNIDNFGSIAAHDFKIAIGILFGLAVLCLLLRILIRLVLRRRLFLDDSFLIFGFVCLTGGTVVLYERLYMIYLEFSVLAGDPTASILAFQQTDELFEQSKWNVAYLLFLWTSIFAVKWCYFAFFHPLLRGTWKWIIYYYWFAVIFSIISWLFLVVGEKLITCPYVGKASAKCFPELPASKQAIVALFWLGPALDGLTDLMVVSIPIIILRRSQMRLLAKLGLGTFLCLSVFMLACSILRAAGPSYHGTLDYPWEVFWLHSEACIGIIMGSVTAYRSTLVGSNNVADKVQFYLNKIIGRRTSSAIADHDTKRAGKKAQPSQRHLLLRIPGATLTGLRTLFGGNSRTRPASSIAPTQNSDLDLLETDYHAYIKGRQADPERARAAKDDPASRLSCYANNV
ncbi:hypothetical protein GJ744_001413 [Endocarpon pusillum]|uniref:Rhodopsin domain-containing protein n=1 Tax=Endocarpon pusillum TaxID=364733 RepID=A0A8H7ANS8_9EURO|nr:hypothetical protein GJ744_001413 [Endocarpon pusillum]